jgi:hypothetical protein
MGEPKLIETKNLDAYGNAALDWERVRGPLADGALHTREIVLGTVRPNGRPHSARVGATQVEGNIYFTSHAKSQKGVNIANNPYCSVSLSLDETDVSFEGKATRVTDAALLEQIAENYRDKHGWPATVAGDQLAAPYSAPSAGPSPWNVYRFDYDTAFGVGKVEPYGATRWRFSPA